MMPVIRERSRDESRSQDNNGLKIGRNIRKESFGQSLIRESKSSLNGVGTGRRSIGNLIS